MPGEPRLQPPPRESGEPKTACRIPHSAARGFPAWPAWRSAAGPALPGTLHPGGRTRSSQQAECPGAGRCSACPTPSSRRSSEANAGTGRGAEAPACARTHTPYTRTHRPMRTRTDQHAHIAHADPRTPHTHRPMHTRTDQHTCTHANTYTHRTHTTRTPHRPTRMHTHTHLQTHATHTHATSTNAQRHTPTRTHTRRHGHARTPHRHTHTDTHTHATHTHTRDLPTGQALASEVWKHKSRPQPNGQKAAPERETLLQPEGEACLPPQGPDWL